MATSMPSRLATISQKKQPSENLVTALRPWRRRISTQQILRWVIGGIITGLVLAGLIFLVARLIPWATAPYWAIGAAVVCPLIALVFALRRLPSLARTAKIIDKRLGLKDRLGTAWEMREQTSVLSQLQRRDALKQLRQHTPKSAISFRVRLSTLLTFLLITLALVLLIVLPNPMTEILKQQAAFQDKMAQQIADVEKVQNELIPPGTTPNTQQKEIDKILEELKDKLATVKNDTEAQQALAEAQAKLNQLRDPQANNKAQGSNAASTTLQGSDNENLQQLGEALGKNDAAATAAALKELAEQVSKMSPEDRKKLSEQLQNAANQAGDNPELSTALRDLAKSINSGNTSDINDAINSLNSVASQDATLQSQNNTISQTAEGLQQVSNNLAQSNDGSQMTSQQGQGQQGQGQQGQGQQGQGQQGQGQQGQQGQGQGQQGQGQGQQGQGQGQQGQGQGQGQQGQGQGQQGQGQGQQGPGGSSGGGGSNAAGKEQGKTGEQVAVPGQVTGGGVSNKEIDNTGSVVQSGTQVSYDEVIGEYSQTAHDSIDNSNVSPDTKDLVKDYFDALGGN